MAAPSSAMSDEAETAWQLPGPCGYTGAQLAGSSVDRLIRASSSLSPRARASLSKARAASDRRRGSDDLQEAPRTAVLALEEVFETCGLSMHSVTARDSRRWSRRGPQPRDEQRVRSPPSAEIARAAASQRSTTGSLGPAAGPSEVPTPEAGHAPGPSNLPAQPPRRRVSSKGRVAGPSPRQLRRGRERV